MRRRAYITCRELIDFIADYFEGALDETQAKDFDRHLSVCASCRAFLATYRTTMQAGIGAVRQDESIDDAPEDLIRAVLKVIRR